MIFLQKSTFVTLNIWHVSIPLILSEARTLWSGNREHTCAKYERLLWNILEVEITGHQSRNGSLGSQNQPGSNVLRVRCNYLYFDTTYSVSPNPQRRNSSFVNNNTEFLLRYLWTTLLTGWMLFPGKMIPFWPRFYSASDKGLTKCPWIFLNHQ